MDDGLLEVAGQLWIHARAPRPAARAAPTRPDNLSDRTPRSGAAQAVTLVTGLPRRSAARRALSRTCPIAQCDVVHRLSHAGRRPVQRTGLGVALDARQCCGRAVGRRWPDRPWPSARPMRQWPHVVVPGQAACLIGCVAVASRLSGGAWPGRLPGATAAAAAGGHNDVVASYAVNPQAVAYARQLIDARQYVLDSDWGRSSPGPAIRTRSCGRIRGTDTPGGIWGSPTVRATTPRPGTPLSTETSAGSIAWASSPATTGQLSGGTKTSNSPPTTCCSTWTPGHLDADGPLSVAGCPTRSPARAQAGRQ